MMTKKYSIIDLHADTPEFVLTDLKGGGNTLWKSRGHIDLPRLESAGALVQAMAIFAPAKPLPYMPADYDVTAYFDRVYAACQQALGACASAVAPVYTYEDIARNQSRGKISFMLTLEDGAVSESNLQTLDALFEKGVRMITLTWNYENCLGYPNSRDPSVMEQGLKAFGKEAVRHMQDRGVIVDVSHLSDGGFWDVHGLCDKPFVASHSGCRALCDHPRNLTDDMLRALGDRGGVVGVTFCAPFLRPNETVSRISDILEHMLHIKNVAGMEALALGSDFDGIDSQLEFLDYGGLPQLFRACEAVFTPREMDMITHENARRVFRDCLPHD